MSESDFSSVQDALDHIQDAVGFVRNELRKGGDHDAVCDLVTALDTISEALREALDASKRLSPGRTWKRTRRRRTN
jgi:hypothetical protein